MADFDPLAGHAASMPDKPAVILGDRTLTFAQLDRRANRVAHVFAGLGCVAEDRVAVMSFNSVESFEVASGLRRSGVVIVPVNYRLRGPEVAYVLNDSGAKVVMAGPDHTGVVEAARAELTGGPRLVSFGEAAPPRWLDYRDLMDRSTDDPVPASGGVGLGPSM